MDRRQAFLQIMWGVFALIFPGTFAAILGLPVVVFGLVVEFLVVLLLWKAAAEIGDRRDSIAAHE